MRRLLVTGGAGFIGANFVNYWIEQHPEDAVTVLDALTYAGNLASLRSSSYGAKAAFVHGDIRDTTLVERLLRDGRVDTLVHFAAESHVDRSIMGPDAFIDTNVIGTHSLLKAARKVWLEEKVVPAHRFHHVSTDEVYGSLASDDPPFTESNPHAPNSPYAASKAASDHLVRAYHHTYGLQVTTSNCSNNYGPLHFPEKLIPLMIVNLLQGRPLPIYGDGRNIRDWLHVSDHCRGIEKVLLHGRVGEIYNIGGRAERENIDLVRSLCAIVDGIFEQQPQMRERFPDSWIAKGEACAASITYVKDRPGHDRRYAIDCRKIERELGFQPALTIEEGLRQTVEWYIANESWWRSIMDGSYRQWIDANYAARG